MLLQIFVTYVLFYLYFSFLTFLEIMIIILNFIIVVCLYLSTFSEILQSTSLIIIKDKLGIPFILATWMPSSLRKFSSLCQAITNKKIIKNTSRSRLPYVNAYGTNIWKYRMAHFYLVRIFFCYYIFLWNFFIIIKNLEWFVILQN